MIYPCPYHHPHTSLFSRARCIQKRADKKLRRVLRMHNPPGPPRTRPVFPGVPKDLNGLEVVYFQEEIKSNDS